MPLLELEKVKLVELVCSHNIHCQAIKKPGVCRMDGIGYLLKKFKLPKNVFFFSKCVFFTVLFLFLFCLYFCCCVFMIVGVATPLQVETKRFMGPCYWRADCSVHMFWDHCVFFFNNKLRCASLEICKNNVRLNALIYAQLLQLPTNFTIQLCFFARKIGSVLCRVMQRECFGRTNLTMPSFVRNIVIAHELRSDQQYSACMAQHDTIPYSDI